MAIVGITFATGAVPAQAVDLSFTGYARAPDSRALLYVESHYVRDAGGPDEKRIVMYRCASGGAAFARKELSYGEVREEPEFSFVDARSGYAEGLRRTPRGPQVYQRESARAPQREAAVPANVVVVSDAGFDEFVRRHWRELEAGRSVRFPFLIPSRLDFMNFRGAQAGRDDGRRRRELGDPAEPLGRARLVPALHRGLLSQERPGAAALRRPDQHPRRPPARTWWRASSSRTPSGARSRRVPAALEAQRAAPLVARCPGS